MEADVCLIGPGAAMIGDVVDAVICAVSPGAAVICAVSPGAAVICAVSPGAAVIGGSVGATIRGIGAIGAFGCFAGAAIVGIGGFAAVIGGFVSAAIGRVRDDAVNGEDRLTFGPLASTFPKDPLVRAATSFIDGGGNGWPKP
jgi:hypothetical protein